MKQPAFIHEWVLFALLSGLAGLAAGPVHAAQDAPETAQATLSAQATAEVEQDTLRATLAAELSAPTQQEVASALDDRLRAVLSDDKEHEGVRLSSGQYRIWPSSDRDGKISEWRGRAEVIVHSQDFKAASQLIARLAAHMPLSGLAFSVSTSRRAQTEQALLEQAVTAFRERAEALTRALGFPGYEIRSLDLNDSGLVPAPRAMRMMSVASDAAATPIEGSREDITVSLQGTIVFVPGQTAASPQ